MKSPHTVLTFFFLLFSLVFASAQQVGDNVSLRMKTGSSLRGEVIEIDEDKVILKTTDFGTITLLQKDIADINQLSKGKAKYKRKSDKKKPQIEQNEGKKEEKVYWYKSPSVTQYMAGSTGYALKKGEMEIQNIWVVFNTFNYGVTDNLTLGAGIELLSTIFNGSGLPGFGITSKYAFPIRPNQLNVSANALFIVYPEDKTQIGIFYGANTLGNRDSNATLGLGFIVTDKISRAQPLIQLGGIIRVGQKFSLITENWIMPPILAPQNDFYGNDEGFLSMLSFGGRHIGKNAIADFSILLDRQNDLALPWISITIPFSR